MLPLTKVIADRNIVPRRAAEALIRQGVVFVNGVQATLGMKVRNDALIEIRASLPTHTTYLFYKPRGIVTVGPQAGERAIKDLVEDQSLFPIGRLDKDSEGLILLTTDGRLTKQILDPKQHVEKEYEVTVDKDITHGFLVGLRNGVRIGFREKTKKTLVKRLHKRGFAIVLTEGKHHQIRRMVKAYGYEVKKLVRFRIGGIQKRLRPGELYPLSEQELTAVLTRSTQKPDLKESKSPSSARPKQSPRSRPQRSLKGPKVARQSSRD